jgi:hypothetical protein
VFRSLINDAKAAASSFVDRYLARASVAVPFVIAFGFATAGAALALAARFGATNAFFMMAAGFCAIGFLAAIAVTLKEQKEQETAAAEEQQAAQSGLGEMATAATQAAGQLPLGLIASALGSPPYGTSSMLALERLLRRHLPLVLLLGLLAFLLFWPGEGVEAEARAGGAEQQPPLDEAPGGEPARAEPGSLREAA